MNERDRLIELISTTTFCPVEGVLATIGSRYTPDFIGCIADHIIANGVIVPPCKQNDVLWMHCTYRAEVHNFQVTDVCWLNGVGIVNTDTMGQFLWEDVGKTVFLTREEAEQALKERSGASA